MQKDSDPFQQPIEKLNATSAWFLSNILTPSVLGTIGLLTALSLAELDVMLYFLSRVLLPWHLILSKEVNWNPLLAFYLSFEKAARAL